MKRHHIILLLLCLCTAVAAQDSIKTNHHHHHTEDTTDVFFRHMKLNELVVTGVTGDTKLKHSTAPINIVSAKDLHSTASTNVIDAIAHQPGMSQLTTGSGISKPIIRGLGYNRVVVMSEGVPLGRNLERPRLVDVWLGRHGWCSHPAQPAYTARRWTER